jgi:type II secretion system protein G
MKNKTLKTTFHRGFTLIELMIVIVILGILMGTILPRITGAQSRARDTARTADLNSISQAMELYYDDFGTYPGTVGDAVCLKSGEISFTFENIFKTYFKGETVPTDPNSSTPNLFVNCDGGYVYLPLVDKSIANNGYALVANIEIAQKANYANGVSPTKAITYSAGSDDTVGEITTALADPTLDSPEKLVAAEAAGSEDDTVLVLLP